MPTENTTQQLHWIASLKVPAVVAVPALAIALLLAVFPQVDILVSGWFYDPQHGFDDGAIAWVDALGEVTSLAGALFVLAGLGLWAWGRMPWPPLPQPLRSLRPNGRIAAYFLLVFILGPLLLVSLGLKENWGRLRPLEITEFGGTGKFTPYYNPTGACDSDCSFSSGHSSRGFFFMAVAILAYRFGWKHRHAILTGALIFGLLAASLRVVEGKHFLSDVLMSGFLVSYVAWVLCGIMFGRSHTPTSHKNPPPSS